MTARQNALLAWQELGIILNRMTQIGFPPGTFSVRTCKNLQASWQNFWEFTESEKSTGIADDGQPKQSF